MRIVGQEGCLLFVDEVPPDMQVGHFIKGEDHPMVLKVVYVDREENEVGFEPIGALRD